ncbi:MAG: nuclear transport factor 2 family protein [Candidatus Thiodiazotropha sp.]
MKIEQLVEWYQNLTPTTLRGIDQLYHESARFQDPFNHVQGVAQISAIFQHMFATTNNPAFAVEQVQVDGDVAWISWIFSCNLRGRELSIEGVSQLMFANDGRVIQHRDYWDSNDLYQQLPLLGRIVRMLKRRFKVPTSYPGAKGTET